MTMSTGALDGWESHGFTQNIRLSATCFEPDGSSHTTSYGQKKMPDPSFDPLWAGLDWRLYGPLSIQVCAMSNIFAELPGEEAAFGIISQEEDSPLGIMVLSGETLHLSVRQDAPVDTFLQTAINDVIRRYRPAKVITDHAGLDNMLHGHFPRQNQASIMGYTGEKTPMAEPQFGWITRPDSFSQVHKLLCQGNPGFAEASPLSQWLPDMCHRQRRGLALSLVYCFGEEIVSTASLIYRHQDGGIIGDVATNPSFRGRGCASVLLDKLSTQLYAQGMGLFLATYQPAFYHRLGWRETGCLITYHR